MTSIQRVIFLSTLFSVVGKFLPIYYVLVLKWSTAQWHICTMFQLPKENIATSPTIITDPVTTAQSRGPYRENGTRGKRIWIQWPSSMLLACRGEEFACSMTLTLGLITPFSSAKTLASRGRATTALEFSSGQSTLSRKLKVRINTHSTLSSTSRRLR